MTESDRHRNTVAKVRRILESIGAEIRINDHERGQGGYRFPMFLTPKGAREFIADIFAVYQGIPIVFEIDLAYHGTRQAFGNDAFRTEQLQNFGIHVIRYTPAMVDTLTAEGVLQDIEYWALGKRRIAV